MAGCCASDYGRVFSSRTARHDARRYRRRGLRGTARRLYRWLRPLAPGATVLEVGGGVGAVQLELLGDGAAQAVNVEISPEYEQAAADLAAERGVAARLERVVGDYVTADVGGDADLVVLHRVVCCYPDMPAMVGKAAAQAGDALALTYPRRTWWVRAGVRLGNAVLRITRNSFRAYVHDPKEILAVASRGGLHRTEEARGLLWESVLCRRT